MFNTHIGICLKTILFRIVVVTSAQYAYCLHLSENNIISILHEMFIGNSRRYYLFTATRQYGAVRYSQSHHNCMGRLIQMPKWRISFWFLSLKHFTLTLQLTITVTTPKCSGVVYAPYVKTVNDEDPLNIPVRCQVVCILALWVTIGKLVGFLLVYKSPGMAGAVLSAHCYSIYVPYIWEVYVPHVRLG